MREINLMELGCVSAGEAALAHDVLEFGGVGAGIGGLIGNVPGAAIGGLIGSAAGVIYYALG